MAATYTFPTDKYVLIGKVAKAHGIKGELKIISFSNELRSVAQHTCLLLISSGGTISPVFNVKKSRIGKKEIIVHLEGIDSRNRAEELAGSGVLVYKTDLPELEADEFYLHELEGISVQTMEGKTIGKVESFFDNGVQDILVVKNGKDEYLIPLIPGMIVKRDKSCLTIAPPLGLLDINSSDEA